MNICRICETIDNLLCSLNYPENSRIVEMLTDLANVSYSNDDQLPKFLCLKCQKSLQFAIEFKRQCEMTDRKLRQISLKLLRTEVEETEDVQHFTCIDEEFPNYAIDNYDTETKKIKHLVEEFIIINSIDIKKDIFLCQETTEVMDPAERAGSTQSGAVKGQKHEPAVYVDKKRCIICNMLFESISALRRHTTTKHKLPKRNQQKEERSDQLTCFYCNKMCSSNIQLERHVWREHCSSEIRTFQCFDCKKEFKNRQIFRAHYENSHSGNSYGCQLCSKRFLTKTSLSRHLRIIHYGERKYECNICHKNFGQKNVLDQHLIAHSEDRPFRCEGCEFACKTSLSLRNHTANKHSIGPKMHKKKNTRPSHRLITTCEYCGKQMPIVNYYAHIRNHTGAKPYKCEICPKSFITPVALRNHTYVHTGEYPYNCNVCHKKFRQQNHLKYHTLVHTGEKPYQCTYCSKTFAIRGNLTVHIRLHTGETPYHCTECSNRFGDLNALKRHKKKDHTE